MLNYKPNRNQRLFLSASFVICEYYVKQMSGIQEKEPRHKMLSWRLSEIGEVPLLMGSREQEIPLEKSRAFTSIKGGKGLWYN